MPAELFIILYPIVVWILFAIIRHSVEKERNTQKQKDEKEGKKDV